MQLFSTIRPVGTVTLRGPFPKGEVSISPGLNTFEDEVLPALEVDPVVAYHLGNGRLRRIAAPEPDVTEPVEPVVEPGWIPTQSQLIELTGIGVAGATTILGVMPVLGFATAAQLIELSGLGNVIDTEELAAIFGT